MKNKYRTRHSPSDALQDIKNADLFYNDLMGINSTHPLLGNRRSMGQTQGEDYHAFGEDFLPDALESTTSNRATVRWLQQSLNRAINSRLRVDGVMGNNTRRAMAQFQQQQQLRRDSRVTTSLLHRLAMTTGTLPPGVWPGPMPTHRGARPRLSPLCPTPGPVLDRFVFARHDLTAAHRRIIGEFARTVVASQNSPTPIHLICLTGHTDAIGQDAANVTLGQRRADAVKRELMAQLERLRPGIRQRVGIWSTSAGETQPLAPNTSDANRARNRRVAVRTNNVWQGRQPSTGSVVIRVRGSQSEALTESFDAQDYMSAIETNLSQRLTLGHSLALEAEGAPRPGANPAYQWASSNIAVATVAQPGGTQTHPNIVNVTGVGIGNADITVTYTSSTGVVSRETFSVTVAAATNLQRMNDGNVRQLQEELRSLGFLMVNSPTGEFCMKTQWAVREFQIYASMETVARIRAGVAANLNRGAHLVAEDNGFNAGGLSHYVSSLEAVANNARYRGHISGVVNADTRAALNHWIANNWRCPVIVEAWTMRRGARHRLTATNLWEHRDLMSGSPRFFVRDFSTYYTMPAGINANDMHVIGDYQSYMSWTGPRSVPPGHTVSQGEIMPDALTGNAAPAGATLSTYRVVRAVSEVECLGFFDSVNCYDNAFVSVGPCHWTLGIVNQRGHIGDGELCGYLSYLKHIDIGAYREAFGNFGIDIEDNWVHAPTGAASGAGLFSRSSRKYSSWLKMQKDDGSFALVPKHSEEEGNYFKHWHWQYRFVMAGRTINGYRSRMWDMARVRLRDIRDVEWGAGVAQVGVGAAARNATIGDVFTSERAMAMVLRWHIRFPAHVVSRGVAGARLRNALAEAQRTVAGRALNWAGDPSGWGDAHEAELIDGIIEAAPDGVQNSLEYVRDWPNWLRRNPRGYALAAPIAARLDDDRDSFDFDNAGLPPAP